MRLRTVRRKLRNTGLPNGHIKEVYERLYGKSDEDCAPGGRYNEEWIEAVRWIFERYLNDLRVHQPYDVAV